MLRDRMEISVTCLHLQDLWNMGKMLEVILPSSLSSDCWFSFKDLNHVYSLNHNLVPGNICDKFMFVRMSYSIVHKNVMFTFQVVKVSC